MLNTSTEKSFAGTEKFTEGQRLCPQGLEDVTNRHRLRRVLLALRSLLKDKDYALKVLKMLLIVTDSKDCSAN